MTVWPTATSTASESVGEMDSIRPRAVGQTVTLLTPPPHTYRNAY